MSDKLEKLVPEKLCPVIFITAMRIESQIILQDGIYDKTYSSGRLRVFTADNHKFIIIETGIGLQSDIFDLEKVLRNHHPGLVVNYGICGALDSHLSQYETFIVNKIRMPDKPEIVIPLSLLKSLFPIEYPFPLSSLITMEKPVVKNIYRSRLFRQYECRLVDMEGYRIAELCMKNFLPLLIVKMVSDSSDENASVLINQNRKIWQYKLKNSLNNIMNSISGKI